MTIGIIVGLVLGKPIGIMLFTFFATKLGFELPPGVRWAQFLGMGLAAGIGFTVSIFISGLAYTDSAVLHFVPEAKIGILVASAIAAIAALLALRASSDPA